MEQDDRPAWSPQQAAALDAVAAWHRDGGQQVFRVFGYAGTGKTTLARHFADGIDGDTVFAAFTGKASIVMRRNGCRNATTIHSLIYRSKQNRKTGELTFVPDAKSAAKDAALIVIDECSMVDEDVGRDLLSYGKPVLVLGDPAQLPPVRGGGFFTDAAPDVMLTEIHRQARDNPIIRLATDVREGRALRAGAFGDSRVITPADLDQDEVMQADQVLVGRNVTRGRYNARMRELLERHSPLPEEGERLVCLKNNRRTGLLNGGLFRTTRAAEPAGERDPHCLSLGIVSQDFEGRAELEVLVREEHFTGGLEALDWQAFRGTERFDYGYALTVHKAQGSQWDRVVLFNEAAAFREDARRWLYTGITRAASTVLIVDGRA